MGSDTRIENKGSLVVILVHKLIPDLYI